MILACNSRTQEVKVGGSWVQSQLGLCSNLFLKQKGKQEIKIKTSQLLYIMNKVTCYLVAEIIKILRAELRFSIWVAQCGDM